MAVLRRSSARGPPAARPAEDRGMGRRPPAVLLVAGDGLALLGDDGRPVHRRVPGGALVAAEVLEVEPVAEALREVRRGRAVRVAIADPRAVTRVLRLPAALRGDELRAAAQLAAADVLPVGTDALAVGIGRLGPAPDDPAQQRVLLAVSRRDAIEQLQRALARAGLRPERVEPAGCALARAAGPPGTTLRIDAGAVTTVAVAEDGACAFAHVAGAGLDAIVEGVVSRTGMDEEHARSWVHAVGAAGLDGPLEGDPVVADEVRIVVLDGLHHLAADVRNALAFHGRSADGAAPSEAVLSGALAAWPDLRAVLERELELPVRAGPDEALLQGLARGAADGVDLRLPGRVSGRRRPLRTGRLVPAALAASAMVCGALGVAVQGHRAVGDREQALAAEHAQTRAIEAQAARLAPFGRLAAAREARERAAVAVLRRQLPWDDVLDDVAAVTPSGVRLSAVRLTASPEAAGAGGAASRLRAARPGPAIELRGCAAGNQAVAAQLDALLAVRGVTTVALDRGADEREGGGRCEAARRTGFRAVAFLEEAGR